MKLEFSTTFYQASHCHLPRGRGMWAFCPTRFQTSLDYLEHTKFAPSNMTLTEAKAWAAKQQWPAGTRSLAVLP